MTNVPMRYKVLAGCLLCVVTALAGAASRFAVTPLVGYRGGGDFKETASGSSISLQGAESYALALNMAATEGGDYELFYSRQASELGGSTPTDMTIEYLHIGGTTPLSYDSERVQPYLGAGIGATRFSPGPASLEDATRWSFSLATGMKISLSERFGLRFEARGYLTWINGRTELFCASTSTGAGCAIQAKGESLFQYEALGGVVLKF